MSTDSASNHTIAFEVTVPRIVLPFSTSAQTTDDATAGPVEDAERVTLLTLPPQRRGHTQRLAQVSAITPEVTTHATANRLFRLFRLKITSIPGQLYALRVHYAQKLQVASTRAPQKVHQLYPPLIDDLACSIEFRSTTDGAAEQRASRSLSAGHHEVVIVLDEEGIPASYSIDGVEG